MYSTFPTSTMFQLYESAGFEAHNVNIVVPPPVEVHRFYSLVSQLATVATMWKLVFIVLILGNLKNLPLVWHLRLINAFRFVLRSQRPKAPPCPAQLFQPIITTSRGPLMEIDLPNLHKTNSSYFTDVDIARIHLICTLFAVGIEKQRGGTAAITGAKGPAFGVALGAVSCSFRREIKPYQEYEMWTRILSWDCKWLYVVTHFVKKGAVVPNVYTLYPSQAKRESWERRGSDDSVSSTDSNAQSAIFATALSKMVFKKGRMTISPKDMLRLSGLLPETMAQSQWKEESPGKLSSAVGKEPLTAEGELAQRFRHDEWTHERIEGERVRGLELASLLGKQDALEETFQGETEVLGRHSDGTGVAGIVSTLAQLGGISKVQLL